MWNPDVNLNRDIEKEEHTALHIKEGNIDYGSNSAPAPADDDNRDEDELASRPVRFQVVVWYVGPIDVVLGIFTMQFRLTVFWSAPTDQEHAKMATTGYGNYDAASRKVWKMEGRQRAYQKELDEILPGSNLVYVPPISILNAVDFSVVGEPEVCLVDETKKMMKWTCMYKASLIQEHMRVTSFPHDEHDLVLRLGILKHRQPGRRWDKSKWRLGLATHHDSQHTIRVPHGLVVDHVQVPEFRFDHTHDLAFEILPLRYGPASDEPDECLQVKLHVRRDSGYYDNNIIPLLAMLNVAGVATLTLEPLEFGSRGEIILAIAFVSIGLRLSVDTKLPNVAYTIKMQTILNRFFYTLLVLHIESSLVYYLARRRGWPLEDTEHINTGTMVASLLYTVALCLNYYKDKLRRQWQKSVMGRQFA